MLSPDSPSAFIFAFVFKIEQYSTSSSHAVISALGTGTKSFAKRSELAQSHPSQITPSSRFSAVHGRIPRPYLAQSATLSDAPHGYSEHGCPHARAAKHLATTMKSEILAGSPSRVKPCFGKEKTVRWQQVL